MSRKKHDRISLWSDFPSSPLLMWKMAHSAWATLWFLDALEGTILQNDYTAPEWSLPMQGSMDGHILLMALRWQRVPCSLKTLLLFLSISTDVPGIVPGTSRWVVGFSEVSQVGKLKMWSHPLSGCIFTFRKALKRDSNCACSWAGLTSGRTSDSEHVLPGGQEMQCHLQSSGDLMH